MARTISKPTMTIGIVAILSGLIAAYGVRSLLEKKEEITPRPPTAPMMRVPLASLDLPADRVITAGDIAEVQMPSQEYFKRYRGTDFTLMMMRDNDIIGRRLREPLKQGQPFLTTVMYLQGTGPSLTEKLRPGYRAVSLLISDSHGGNVQPGTRVDVLFRAQARAARAGQPAIPEMTVTLLRHIEVLEVNRTGAAQPSAEAKSALITLAVPIEKAGVLSAVEGRGDLWLSATSPKETATSPPQPEGVAVAAAPGSRVTLEEILGVQMPKPPFYTAIFRRNRMQINTFVDGQLVSRSGTWSPESTAGDCPTCGKQGQGAGAPLTPLPDASTPAGPDEGSTPAPEQPAPADKRT